MTLYESGVLSRFGVSVLGTSVGTTCIISYYVSLARSLFFFSLSQYRTNAYMPALLLYTPINRTTLPLSSRHFLLLPLILLFEPSCNPLSIIRNYRRNRRPRYLCPKTHGNRPAHRDKHRLHGKNKCCLDCKLSICISFCKFVNADCRRGNFCRRSDRIPCDCPCGIRARGTREWVR